MYSGFLIALKEASSGNNICAAAWREERVITQSSSKIVSAVETYLNGLPLKSLLTLHEGLDLLQPHLEHLIVPPDELANLFRVREIDTLANPQRTEIFHVPFELRHRIASQRYSIAGWPSLYLGASLAVCWEEMGRPIFHKLAVADFKGDQNLKVLDFGYRPSVMADRHMLDEHVTSYIICWPLLAACSICPRHRGSPFVEEYIVPQQFLQWLRDKTSKIDGIRYFSMKVHQTSEAPRLAINYVFPVRTYDNDGHCQELKKRFKLTLPIAWSLLEAIDPIGPGIQYMNEPYPVNRETTVRYDDTMFGKLERRLRHLPKEQLT